MSRPSAKMDNLRALPRQWQGRSSGFRERHHAKRTADWTYEERDSYFAGHYDVRCDECDATGKVRVPDVERMTFAQKREWARGERERRENAADMRALAREQAAERLRLLDNPPGPAPGQPQNGH